jgi:rhamnulokinase
MKTARILAVDLGASGGKCFAGQFSAQGFSMTEIHRFSHEGVSFFSRDSRGNGAAAIERTYWNDTGIYSQILDGLRAYRREIHPRLDAVGIDAWGADGQLFSRDGEALGKMYCYRDHRLDTMIDEVKTRMAAERAYAITGNHFQNFNPSNQLLWLATRRPDFLLRGCFWLPAPSVFYYYLGGVKMVDSTWAGVTQLMNAKTRRWSGEMLRALGIPRRILPSIVPPGAPVGALLPELAERLGLNAAPLVATASHDTASAFAAAPVADADEALIISSGTWSLVGKLIPSPLTTLSAMRANFSNEGGIGNTRFLKNCMGTWLVQELRRQWTRADGRAMPWSEISRLARSAPAFAAYIDPDDPSFYNPSDMEQAIAAFCRRTRQKVPADRATFLRVVYEGLAFKYRLVDEDLARILGRKTTVAHIVGGGSRNVVLNQFAADALNMPVVAGPEEATAVGNIMTQARALGLVNSSAQALSLIRQAFPLKTFRPRRSDVWDRAYGEFRRTLAAGRER